MRNVPIVASDLSAHALDVAVQFPGVSVSCPTSSSGRMPCCKPTRCSHMIAVHTAPISPIWCCGRCSANLWSLRHKDASRRQPKDLIQLPVGYKPGEHGHHGIIRDERHALRDRLGREHPVERIAVFHDEQSRGESMRRHHRQLTRT